MVMTLVVIMRMVLLTKMLMSMSFELAASRTTWMPAHGGVHTIGVARDSRGKPITAVMWRANRLVDFLAKSAAAGQRLPPQITRDLISMRLLARYSLAKLGAVTREANHHAMIVDNGDGTVKTRIKRDSEGLKQRCAPRLQFRRVLGQAAPLIAGEAASIPG